MRHDIEAERRCTFGAPSFIPNPNKEEELSKKIKAAAPCPRQNARVRGGPAPCPRARKCSPISAARPRPTAASRRRASPNARSPAPSASKAASKADLKLLLKDLAGRRRDQARPQDAASARPPAGADARRHCRARRRRRTDRQTGRMGRRGRSAAHPRRAAHATNAKAALRRASARACCCASNSTPTPRRSEPAYSGRVVKIVDKAKARVLGVYRELEGGGGRALPVEKRGARARNLRAGRHVRRRRRRRSRRAGDACARAVSACRPPASSNGSARSNPSARSA